MEELDDLHEPTGCILEAQALAAELWGAEETLFMINGTTGAIHAMLLGTLNPGDKVLVPRNAHRSIIGGIILAGAEPVYVQPEINNRLGIAMGLSTDEVQNAIKANREAKALVAVYPTYYGFCCNLGVIAHLVHEAGMLLLVDEAHGAHLRFSEKLPQQALDLGADVVAQSTHKLLGSMTQTSMLHIGSDRVDRGRLRQAAGLLQSTSPNQLLLASLDIARLQMAQEGEERVNRAVRLSSWLRQEINCIPGLYSPGQELCAGDGRSGAAALDAAKVTVNLYGLCIGGQEAELILRHEYKVQCELSDPANLLFIISMADTMEQVCRLLEALRNLAGRFHGSKEILSANMAEMPEPQQAVDPRGAFFAMTDTVKLEMAEGCISAETVAFYPPGIPVLCPGERISGQIIEYIRYYQARGMRLSGPTDGNLATIRICRGM